MKLMTLLDNNIQKIVLFYWRHWVQAANIDTEQASNEIVDRNKWFLELDFSQSPDEDKNYVRLYFSDTNDSFKTSIKRYRNAFEKQLEWGDLHVASPLSLEAKDYISEMPSSIKEEIFALFRGSALITVDSVTEEVLSLLIVKPGRTNSGVKEVSFYYNTNTYITKTFLMF
jgi:hypothetical protein